jgi:hypothetical protein
MGMYTELYIKAKLKADPEAISVIKFLQDSKYGEIPTFNTNYSLFKTQRWEWMLRGGSGYFSTQPYQVLEDKGDHFIFENCSNIKNYDNEYEYFLEWLSPYIIEEEGHIHYEEYQNPSVIEYRNGKLEVMERVKGNLDDY